MTNPIIEGRNSQPFDSAVTSHPILTDSSVAIGHAIVIAGWFGPNCSITTPAGFTRITTSSAGIVVNTFAAFYKIATVAGAQSIDLVTDLATRGIVMVFNLSGTHQVNPLAQYSYDVWSAAGAYTLHSVRLTTDATTVLLFSGAEDTDTAGWSCSPSVTTELTEASTLNSMRAWSDFQDAGDSHVYTIEKSGTAEYLLAIFIRPLTINLSSIQDEVLVGVTYNETIIASGGTSPYSFAITSGALPPGLSLNGATGQINGTLTAAGYYSFTVEATDANGYTGSRYYIIYVYTLAPTTPTGPLAAASQTFDNKTVYLHTRNGPNNWSTKEILYSGLAVNSVGSFSAGALSVDSFVKRGIILESSDLGTEAIFIGNGQPDTAFPMPAGHFVIDFWNGSHGAWYVNAAHYAIMRVGEDLTMLKSVDDGANWTAMDQVNAPAGAYDTGTGVGLQVMIRYVEGVQKVYVFAMRKAGTGGIHARSFYTFDMATELWSAHFGDIDMGKSIVTDSKNSIIPYGNGDIGVLYSDYSGDVTPPVTYYRLYASATWGAEITVGTGAFPDNGTEFAQVIIDPSGELLHACYYRINSGFNNVLTYKTVTHAGIVSSLIFEWPVPIGGSDGVGSSIIFNEDILIPYDQKSDHANGVWVAPLSTGQFVKELMPVPRGEEGKTPSCAFMIFATKIQSFSIPPEYIRRRAMPGS